MNNIEKKNWETPTVIKLSIKDITASGGNTSKEPNQHATGKLSS